MAELLHSQHHCISCQNGHTVQTYFDTRGVELSLQQFVHFNGCISTMFAKEGLMVTLGRR
jgi:hypothetical protein